MKIAWCHNGVTGGAKRATHELVRELSRRGHVIDEFVICDVPAPDFLPLQPWVRNTHCTVFGKTEEWYLRPYALQTAAMSARRWRQARRIEQELRRLADRINQSAYDVVHIDHQPSCSATGLLPYLRRPAVVYSHEASGQRYGLAQQHGALNGQSRLRRWYAHVCALPVYAEGRWRRRHDIDRLRRARLVLTNSEYSKKTLFQTYGRLAQTCYLGVDQERFRPLGVPVEPMVLSVGRLVAAKQHHVVIEAVGRIDAAHRPSVTIATPESQEGADIETSLTRLAETLRVELRIVRAPSQEELVALYNQALAVVFVPLMEPFGLVAIEAMACGTPVIGVREGGVREIVLDGVTGLLVERQAQQIAEALERLRTHTALRDDMGHRSIEAVRKQWTWEQAAGRYERAVAEAMHG